MDLHLHTPASADFKQSNVSYLDFLKKADAKNLNVIAFTDHNSVAGYAQYLQAVESLEMLERLNRLTDDERKHLADYRRLREKILILPGFEFTATLGFHILGIFPPETTARALDHLLLSLNIPPDKLDDGSGEVGATTDALTAYRMINAAGGLAIAAHANSSHGVAMPGFDFGGQTRIAYTQDANLHALEVTDLDSKSRRRTAMFFNGLKPEYPRRMHCIQGSDAHKLDFDPKFKNEMGVGDRATEILIDEISFDAIKDVFLGSDFSRTRPYRGATEEPYDPLREAREQGDTLVQAFHERLHDKRAITPAILHDVVALANTNGGTIYVGASANIKNAVVGVERPEHAIADVRAAIAKQITPPLEVQIETVKSQGKTVLQMIVPRGSDVPYALDSSHIYIRSENETNLAMRDEIVQLVRESLAVEGVANAPVPTTQSPQVEVKPEVAPAMPPPRTGVEIVACDVRKSVRYYSVRDLRNERIVHNVTLASARSLWQYAISEQEKSPVKPDAVQWSGDMGIWKTHKRGGKVRYDLAQRASEKIIVYYGVTEDGLHGAWRKLIEGEAVGEEIPEIESRANIGTPAEIAAESEELTHADESPATVPEEEMFQPPIISDQVAEVYDSIAPSTFDLQAMDETPAIPETEISSPFGEPLPAFGESEIASDESAPEFPQPTAESAPVITAQADEGTTPEEIAPPFEMRAEPETLPEESAPVIEPPAPPPAPKTRAQTWREQLDRALAEMRAARAPKTDEGQSSDEGSSGG
ncbi:MAG: putative DNA binding domain-containing protein [Chloroflexi bacterium]|nr:putative DNA binding domain-containing protein [Chloroflexota bacterium]